MALNKYVFVIAFSWPFVSADVPVQNPTPPNLKSINTFMDILPERLLPMHTSIFIWIKLRTSHFP